MRVNRECWELKDVAHDDACRLVADSGQAFKFFERVRNFAIELFDERLRELENIHAFGVKETARLDDFGNTFYAELDHLGGSASFFEEDCGHLVYADVCALGAQNDGDKERVWVCEIQGNGRIWVQLVKLIANEFDFVAFLHAGTL